MEIIIRCAALSEDEVSKICREQGLYPHHIKQWKQDFVGGATMNTPTNTPLEAKHLKHQNKALKNELNRKDRALAETAALLVLQKKSKCHLGKGRGQLTVKTEREKIIVLINEATEAGARQSTACDIIGISTKTIQRFCTNIGNPIKLSIFLQCKQEHFIE
ncbi:MAG: transposase-like protein [Paraglaciecola sp.]